MATLAERLQEAMKIRNISQSKLVVLTGISKGSISTYLSGNYEPKRLNIYKLANALNISENWLMGLDVPMQKTREDLQNDDDEQFSKIPMLKKITLDTPLLSKENIQGYRYVLSKFINPNNEYFFMTVFDNSMNLKFKLNDEILIQRQDHLENEEIGIIMINDVITIRQYRFENNLIILEPLSDTHQEKIQVYNPKDIQLTIIGKVLLSINRIN